MPKIIQNDPHIVIAGSWNVAILSPSWLQKHFPEIFVAGEKIPIDVKFGGVPEVKFNVGDMIIHPSSSRLTINCLDPKKETYERKICFSKGIIGELHHTPITGIGHNIAYNLDDNETFSILDNQIVEGYEDFYAKNLTDSMLISQSIQHSIGFENKTLNLSYNIDKKKKIISFNFHYEITSSINEEEVISEFYENIEYSKNALEKLINK